MKRKLAWILAACLLFTGVLPAYAEEMQPEEILQEIEAVEEVVVVEEIATESVEAANAEAADAPEASLLSAGTPEYLYLENIGTESVTITIMSAGLGDGVDLYEVPAIKSSLDKTVWTDVAIGAVKKKETVIEVPQGSTVYFKGDFTPADEFSSSKYIRFTADGTDDASLKLGGDITTLLNGVGGIDDLGSLSFPRYNGKYAFTALFSDMEALTDISDLKLPSTKLNEYCYYRMFAGTGIREIPEGLLPATSLAPSCYKEMFSDCEALERISAGLLPATEVADFCYDEMFCGCTALEEIPGGFLPATDLTDAEEGCYGSMFYGCSSLKTIPEDLLPATKLSEGCYMGMFVFCPELEVVPARLLPAEELAESCYNSMFTYCTSLKEAPDLPAENLVVRCYAHMFEGCEKLESVRVAFEKWGSSEEEDPDYSATDSFLPFYLADGTVLSFRCSRNLPEDDDNIIWLKDLNQIELLKGLHTVTAQENEYGTLEPDHYLYHEDDDTVILTPVPAEGMSIIRVIYKDYQGEHDAEPVEGKYQFTMPASDVTVWAAGEEKWVTITYLGFGGSPFLEIGQPVGLPAGEFRPDEEPGYVFDGWYADEACTEEWDFETPVMEDTTLYSKWKEVKKFTVTFDSQGGSTVPSQDVEEGGKAARPSPDPVREGYTFDDWYTTEDCTVLYDFDMAIDRDITIYAKWIKKSDPKPDDDDDDDEEPSVLFTGSWDNAVSNGSWTIDANGVWHYSTSRNFRNTWGYILNPYAGEGQSSCSWFWFDQNGNMLTGWQFINGKWYYLNPTKDGTLGACQLGGVTPDGWTVDENGAWIESIPQK